MIREVDCRTDNAMCLRKVFVDVFRSAERGVTRCPLQVKQTLLSKFPSLSWNARSQSDLTCARMDWSTSPITIAWMYTGARIRLASAPCMPSTDQRAILSLQDMLRTRGASPRPGLVRNTPSRAYPSRPREGVPGGRRGRMTASMRADTSGSCVAARSPMDASPPVRKTRIRNAQRK